jgi:O-antigen ligase
MPLAGLSLVLSLFLALSTVAGAPVSLLVLAAILTGGAMRGRVPALEPLATLLMLFIGLSILFRPPETDPGLVAAYSLVYLLLGIWATHSSAWSHPNIHLWIAFSLIGTMGVALLQVYSVLTGSYAAYETVRVFESILGSSNSAAWKAGVVGIVAASLGVQAKGMTRVFLLASAGFFLAAPIAFASRGALVAVAVGLLLIAAQFRRRRALTFIATALLAGALSLSYFAARQGWFVWRRLTDAPLVTTDITSGRTTLWADTWEQFLRNPILGVGPGRVTDTLYTWHGFAYAHNLPLELLAQMGVVAGVALMVYVLPRPVRLDNPYLPAIGAALTASLLEPAIATPVGAIVYVSLMLAYRNHLQFDETRST